LLFLGVGPIVNQIILKTSSLLPEYEMIAFSSNLSIGKTSYPILSYNRLSEIQFDDSAVFVVGWRESPSEHSIFAESRELVLEATAHRPTFLISSASVYGNTTNPATELSPASPINAHGRSRLDLEKWARRHTQVRGIFRVANVYGDFQLPGIVDKIIGHMKSSQKDSDFEIQGAPEHVRDFVPLNFVSQVISELVWHGAKNPSADEVLVNVSSGLATTLADVAELAKKFSGLSFKFSNLDPSEVIAKNILSPLKLQELLGIRQLPTHRDLEAYLKYSFE